MAEETVKLSFISKKGKNINGPNKYVVALPIIKAEQRLNSKKVLPASTWKLEDDDYEFVNGKIQRKPKAVKSEAKKEEK